MPACTGPGHSRPSAEVVPPQKKLISIRLDPDLIEFFQEEGAGYQTRINRVLRAYVDAVRKKAG